MTTIIIVNMLLLDAVLLGLAGATFRVYRRARPTVPDQDPATSWPYAGQDPAVSWPYAGFSAPRPGNEEPPW